MRPFFVLSCWLFLLSCGLDGTAAEAVRISSPDYTKITGFAAGAAFPESEPIPLWKVTAATLIQDDGRGGMVGLSNVVVGGGTVYFGDDLGRVFALAAEGGAELWMHEHGKRISNEPSIDAEHVYFGSAVGITAVRRDTGKQVWQHPVKRGANETTPLPVADRVYASAYDGHAYALDRATGKVIWKHDFAADAPKDRPGFDGEQARMQNTAARPRGAACDGEIFVQGVFDQSRFVAIDCRTGKRRWSFQTAGWTGAAPTIVGNRVYLNSQDKHLYCVDHETGKLVWKFAAASWLSSQPAVHDGKVLQPCNGNRLYILEAATGKLLHTFQPDDEADRKGSVYSFPIIANGAAHFCTGEGRLYAVEIATGKLRWRLRPSEVSELFTDPVTDGERIFVTTRRKDGAGESAIYAIGWEEER